MTNKNYIKILQQKFIYKYYNKNLYFGVTIFLCVYMIFFYFVSKNVFLNAL